MGCAQSSSAGATHFDSSGHVHGGSLQQEDGEYDEEAGVAAAAAFQDSARARPSAGSSRRKGASRYAVAAPEKEDDEEELEAGGRGGGGRGGGGGFYTDIGDFADQSGGRSKRRRPKRRNRQHDEDEMAVSDDLKDFAQSLKGSATSKKSSRQVGTIRGGGNVVLGGQAADLLPGQRLGRFGEDEDRRIPGDSASMVSTYMVSGGSHGFIPEASVFDDDDPSPL
jgi:hypothetical protein